MTKRALFKGALMALATVGWGSVAYDAVPTLWPAMPFTAGLVGLAIFSTVLRGWVITLEEVAEA
jgi:hypothetical protein